MLTYLLLLGACTKEPSPPVETTCDPIAAQADAPPLRDGPLEFGAAEAPLLQPVGTPLGGYTARCGCFGGMGKADYRGSNYKTEFAASAGVQLGPNVKAFWFSNGDQDLVLVKIDQIFSYDGLVEELETRLTAATGRALDGKVVVTTGHTHSGYGDFVDQVSWFLGADRFNYEVFSRLAAVSESVALEAWAKREPARIGVGYAKDWDPDDRVYRDRRGDNDATQFFDDIPAGRWKDPNLAMLRIDALDGTPLAALFNFGIHGTLLDVDNPMASSDAPGHVERAFQERFDVPVVVALLQGATGDASPAGGDDGYARMENVGERAADTLVELWQSTPTSDAPLHLETVSRSVDERHDAVRITRGGTVDLRYTPFQEGLVPDNVVYADDGTIATPIDEFNTLGGAVFCGESPAYLPGYAPADVPPYANCVVLEKMIGVVTAFFDLTDAESALPLIESQRAAVSATRIGPLVMREPDGTEVSDDLFVGFFPGEATSVYTEHFRRRARTELGFEHTLAVSYSQDHEGYLLTPEDWLLGGYEIDINQGGPLQGEHIMEQLLVMAEELTTDVVEHPDPCEQYLPTPRRDWTLPNLVPDLTPDAGTLLDAPPEYLWSPLYSDDERDAGVVPGWAPPERVPRVQGLVEMAWLGGDPGVDQPQVTLEVFQGGAWRTVVTPSGRDVTSGPEILLTHTPQPLAPAIDPQAHLWYAAWQAVGSTVDRAALPLGTYRLRVDGATFVGGDDSYPWDAAPYVVEGPAFELSAGEIEVSVTGTDVYASVRGPARGYRMIHEEGSHRGDNPLEGDVATLTFGFADGTEQTAATAGVRADARTMFVGVVPDGAVSVRVVDAAENVGTTTW